MPDWLLAAALVGGTLIAWLLIIVLNEVIEQLWEWRAARRKGK